MTYTTKDFRNARFAYFSDHSVARRVTVSGTHDPATPWRARDSWLSDKHMAASGWTPVQESKNEVTEDMILRALVAYHRFGDRKAATSDWEWERINNMDRAITAALTVPTQSPESIEVENALIDEIGVGVLTDDEFTEIADSLSEKGFQFVPDYSKNCGKGPCALEDGHYGRCRC